MSKTAFVFPGQGSQHIGMLAELAESEPQVKETFAQASEILGYDLWALTQDGPEEKLNQTQITQPALLVAGVALWRVWLARGGEVPSLMAGHSLGEYTALTCAGVISFQDAVSLVEKRGKYMQEAVPAGEGSMAAIIGLDDEKVRDACEIAAEGEVVEAVNYNSPGQVVIAGKKSAVERAMVKAKELGAKRALPLSVSAPSHCALMKPAAERLAVDLDSLTLNPAKIPVVHNVTADTELDLAKLKTNLVEQLYRPVLWTDSVNYLAKSGITRTVECGPGKVLSGLNRRINKSLSVEVINDPAGMLSALENGEA